MLILPVVCTVQVCWLHCTEQQDIINYSAFLSVSLAYSSTTCWKGSSQPFNIGAFFFHQLLSLLIFWVFLFLFRGRYWNRVQGLGLRTQDSYPPWPAQEHHQPAGSMHAGKAIDGDHGICPSWQLALFSSIKEGHLRTRLDQDNKWSAERVHFSWSGDGWLSS